MYDEANIIIITKARPIELNITPKLAYFSYSMKIFGSLRVSATEFRASLTEQSFFDIYC